MTAAGPGPVLSASAYSPNDTHDGSDPAVTDGVRGRVVAARKTRFGLLRYFAAGVLSLMLVFAPAAPVRASLLDCLEAAVPIGDAVKLGELATEVGLCLSQFAADPVADVVMATVIALAAHGDIPVDTDACNAAVDGVIGKALAQALLDLLGNDLNDQEKQWLNNVIGGSASLSSIVALIPVLGWLEEELHCACTIVGAPGQAARIAKDWLGHAEGCGKFFESIGEAILTGLEYLLCGFSAGLICPEDSCDHTPDPSDQEGWYWFCDAQNAPGGWKGSDACFNACEAANWGDRNCRGILCDAGQQCGGGRHDQCVPCPSFNKNYKDYQGNWQFKNVGIVQDDGSCGCSDNYQPVYQQTAGGNILTNCTCPPPYQDIGDGYCHCPKGQETKNGVCAPCGDDELYSDVYAKCYKCSTMGTKPDAAHEKCVAACDASKGEYFAAGTHDCRQCDGGANVAYYNPEMQGGYGHCEPKCQPGQILQAMQTPVPTIMVAVACYTCPDNTYAVYDNPDSSYGHCEACPGGTSSSEGATDCTPLDCGASGYRDPDNPHGCKYCPATQIYIPAKKELVKQPDGTTTAVVVPGHCGCGEFQRPKDDGKCECAAGTIQHCWDPGSCDECKCPEGAYVDQATFACMCPAGATLDPTGAKCQCPYGQHIEGDKCVPPTLQKIPLPKDCSTLGPNFINNPKNAAACVRCPAGRIANKAGTACVRAPAPPVRRAIPPKKGGEVAKPVLQCPPRTMPNAAGTACIPQLDMPDFGTPGSLAPPGGRGVPGVGVPTRR